MRRLIGCSVWMLLLASAALAAKPLPFPPGAKPDLTFSAYAVTSPAVIHCGQQTIVFNVTETNLGTAPSGPYVTHHFSNGVAFCAKSRPNLPPGTSASFTDTCNLWNGPCDCPPTSYTIPFFGFVDPGNALAELDETNNQSPTVIRNAQCP